MCIGQEGKAPGQHHLQVIWGLGLEEGAQAVRTCSKVDPDTWHRWAQAPGKELGVRDEKPVVPFMGELTEANRNDLEMTCRWSRIHSTNIPCNILGLQEQG